MSNPVVFTDTDHEHYQSRVVMRDEKYACANQLITVIEAMEYDFAIWLTQNKKYNTWDIRGRRRYYSKVGMPQELAWWFQMQEDYGDESI